MSVDEEFELVVRDRNNDITPPQQAKRAEPDVINHRDVLVTSDSDQDATHISRTRHIDSVSRKLPFTTSQDDDDDQGEIIQGK